MGVGGLVEGLSGISAFLDRLDGFSKDLDDWYGVDVVGMTVLV